MITIVSGLPRCGTSLMMRMLEKGGLPILSDGVRAADEDNPKGYYEFEAVKQIKEDASFLDQADGKVFKMVSQLLYDLPESPRYQYKILFMHRDLDEMMASQNKMLERRGEPLAPDDDRMKRLFEKHLEQMSGWLADRPDIEVLDVSYNALMRDPAPIVPEVVRFLGDTLDAGAMLGAIDPSLYRNRSQHIA
ncbi:MAG: sulfotransferase [Candidatus Eiseniibacteriota bacterium]|jgi:hypothetical protein